MAAIYHDLHIPLIFDTAHGVGLVLKISNYVFEVIAGLGMMANTLINWYCCPERHMDMIERVPDPDDLYDSDSDDG